MKRQVKSQKGVMSFKRSAFTYCYYPIRIKINVSWGWLTSPGPLPFPFNHFLQWKWDWINELQILLSIIWSVPKAVLFTTSFPGYLIFPLSLWEGEKMKDHGNKAVLFKCFFKIKSKCDLYVQWDIFCIKDLFYRYSLWICSILTWGLSGLNIPV